YGELTLEIPRDRNGEFKQQTLPAYKRLRQELCVNGKAHSVDQVKTLILMYHVFL
ncbi:transposase, partial [Enterococcus faecium]